MKAMLEVVLAQPACEQPACDAISIAVIVAYTVAVTAAILAVIYFVRRRASDRRLH